MSVVTTPGLLSHHGPLSPLPCHAGSVWCHSWERCLQDSVSTTCSQQNSQGPCSRTRACTCPCTARGCHRRSRWQRGGPTHCRTSCPSCHCCCCASLSRHREKQCQEKGGSHNSLLRLQQLPHATTGAPPHLTCAGPSVPCCSLPLLLASMPFLCTENVHRFLPLRAGLPVRGAECRKRQPSSRVKLLSRVKTNQSQLECTLDTLRALPPLRSNCSVQIYQIHSSLHGGLVTLSMDCWLPYHRRRRGPADC